MPKRSAKTKAKTSKQFTLETRKPAQQTTKAVDIRKEWPKEWQAMIEEVGSSAKLAEEFGVSHMTIHRWGTGDSSPNKLERLAIQKWCTDKGLNVPRWND